MYDSDETEVCIGLAFIQARRKQMGPVEAYQWAKGHWQEFLPQLITRTGQMLLEIARQRRGPLVPEPK